MKKPLIAISSGDPAGIGPEVTVKALSIKEIYDISRPLVICDARVINNVLDILGYSLKVNIIDNPVNGKYEYGTIDVLDIKNADPGSFSYGQVSEITGKASFEYVKKVIDLAIERKADATVTGPINKDAINKAGYHFAGHTEIFAHYTGSSNYAMMLVDGEFRVVHVNTHVSMLESIKRITKERVLNVIILANKALKGMGIEKPRIAVNGLNPHAGESGLFGSEEINHIIPAIEEARSRGICVDGPHPPDTIFPKMRGGQYDIVVCMYHDQGHIPIKLLGFRYNDEKKIWEGISGVNITLGLPIIRVSVDHGTAFGKAGKGKANPESMHQAIVYAVKLAKNR